MVQKPRLLALVTEALGGEGGIAQYNRDLLAALSADWSVSALVRLSPRPLSEAPFEQYGPHFSRVSFIAEALRLARRLRPSVILNGHIYLTPLSLTIARLFRAKLVTQLHGTEIWVDPGRIRRSTASSSDLVLAVSNHTLDEARKFLRIRESAVLSNTFRPVFQPGDRSAARDRFAPGRPHVVLTVGRLDDRMGYKGHDRVIRALAKWQQPDWLYLVAGSGPDQERLQSIAKREGVADRVRFLGYVPDSELPDLYRSADVFALPSTGEGFGIVYLEAMACGTTAIGLNVGGAASVLQSNGLGVATEPAEFEKTLIALMEQPPLRASSRRELATQVSRLYGPEVFRSKARSIFKRYSISDS